MTPAETFRALDRIQFRLANAEAEITRLQLRILGLETGKPLPPDQVIEVVPAEPQPTPEPQAQPQIQKDKPAEVIELDLKAGMLMPTGPRRS